MKRPRVELICVGSELLSHRVNTHTVLIGQTLLNNGFSLSRSQTVGDDPKEMGDMFKEAWKRADVVLCAGGLGPTFDDITRETWAKVLKRKLVYRPEITEEIKNKFARRGVRMPPRNKRQGYLLNGALVLNNRFGTAPGQTLKIKKKYLFLLPGPKRELGPILEDGVLPILSAAFKNAQRRSTFLYLHGVPESVVDQKIASLVKKKNWPGGVRATYGILASNSVITVKYGLEGKDPRKTGLVDAQLKGKIKRLVRRFIFSETDPRLEKATLEKLREKKKTLAVAESCTGGLIAKMITDIPGSSDHFIEGFVTYSNRAKMKTLGVKKQTLKKWGAVSSQVAAEMAKGALKKSGAGLALSVTGVAGPGGGSPLKPVGLVYFGLAKGKKVFTEKIEFKGDRDWIRQRSAMKGFSLILDALRSR